MADSSTPHQPSPHRLMRPFFWPDRCSPLSVDNAMIEHRTIRPILFLTLCWFCASLAASGCVNLDEFDAEQPQAAAGNGPVDPEQRLAAGDEHTCLVNDNGQVVCWGSNVGRQLGHDFLPKANEPSVVPGITRAVEVAGAKSHTCVRTDDLKVRCWGGTNLSTQNIEGLRDVVDIAAGGSQTCAVEHDGHVKCWNMRESSVSPDPVAGLTDAVQVALGTRHACARTRRGTVSCWGSGKFGQLGDGGTRFRAQAHEIEGLFRVASIAAGKSHTCALGQNGAVACWGWGGRGQLGVGSLEDSGVPVNVQRLSGPAVELAAGADFTCARMSAGDVQCWGIASMGQLGNGIAEEEAMFTRPVTVKHISDATALTAGADHACALETGGEMFCWGSNKAGQLGEGPQLFRPLPSPNEHLKEPVLTLEAGSAHACAVMKSGIVKCWGHNATWQLGNRGASRSAVPIVVKDVNTAVAVTNGGKHTCALLQGGKVSCWGTNGRGQMGDERREARTRAKEVPKLEGVVMLDAGLHHTCAVRRDKSLWCWGDNRFAQLGDGTRSLKTRPTYVRALGKSVVGVAAAAKHTCALKEAGDVWCWGKNEAGQVGDGTTRQRMKPTAVKGIGGRAVELEAYQNRTCARREDGAVMCWGDHKTTAKLVARWPKSTSLTMGVAHVCAREDGGTVSCTGNNYSGQLGDGSRIFRPESFRLTTVTGVTEVAAGKRFTCALTDAGAVSCWGDNHFGQLGYVGTNLAASPVKVIIPGT